MDLHGSDSLLVVTIAGSLVDVVVADTIMGYSVVLLDCNSNGILVVVAYSLVVSFIVDSTLLVTEQGTTIIASNAVAAEDMRIVAITMQRHRNVVVIVKGEYHYQSVS